MNVLVVGGAGYIGSHIVRELLDSNNKVTVYDNLSTGSRKNLFPEANFIEGDILDTRMLETAFCGRYDGVFHFAALKAAGESMVHPEKYSTTNIAGTINVLNASISSGVKAFVFSSTAAVYGEPEYVPIDEQHPVKPKNYYGFTKLEIERILNWYDTIKGLKFAALRYFNAAGYDEQKRVQGLECNPQNLLPVIMEVAIGKRKTLSVFGDDYDTFDGTGVRDYVHVSDLADAHMKALKYLVLAQKSITVNLGSEKGISVKEMVETARAITGKKIPAEIVGRRVGDPAALFASSKKAEAVLHWKAERSTAEQLISTTWQIYQDLSKSL